MSHKGTVSERESETVEKASCQRRGGNARRSSDRSDYEKESMVLHLSISKNKPRRKKKNERKKEETRGGQESSAKEAGNKFRSVTILIHYFRNLWLKLIFGCYTSSSLYES